MAPIRIPGTEAIIGGNRVFIVADIGKNFIQTEEDQSLETYTRNAEALIDAAADAGVDAVKFQTHDAEDEQLDVRIVSPHFPQSDRYSWVKRNTEATPMRFWREMEKHCRKRNVLFLSTPMSRKAAEKLDQIGVPLWKIGSGDVRDHVLLDYVCATGKPVIISTGMVSLAELDAVGQYITLRHCPLVILYCISKYPCPPEDFNLATLELLREKYPHAAIGFSDHSIGYDAALAAARLGATVIEKHFSLSRGFYGADHKVSMTPVEMKEMVTRIRSGAFQSTDPAPYLGERTRELEGALNTFRPYFDKVLRAGRNLPEGRVLAKGDIFAMRPAKGNRGLPATEFERIIGKKLRKTVRKYDPLTAELFA